MTTGKQKLTLIVSILLAFALGMGAAGGIFNTVIVSAHVHAYAGNAFALPIVEIHLQGIQIGLGGDALPDINRNGFLRGTAAGGQDETSRYICCNVMFHSSVILIQGAKLNKNQ